MTTNWGARALLVAGTFLSACNETTALPPVTDLATARALWTQNEPRSYEFTFEKSCFCTGLDGPLVVSVRNGVVQSVRSRTGRALEEPWDDDIVLVGDMFDRIESAQDDGAIVQSEYDPERGYPTVVLIDRLPFAEDDEVAYRISGLRPTRPSSSEFLPQQPKLPF